MKKVLILSASYGEGHNAAARGLLAALAQQGAAEAEFYDPFPEAMGALYDRSRRDYLRLIERWRAKRWHGRRWPAGFHRLTRFSG